MKKIAFVFTAIFLCASPVWALDVPPLAGQRVHDLAGVLTESQQRLLTQRLADFEAATGNQVAILVVDSLEGEAIESFSLRVAETWKIGRKGRDNGLLIAIAVKDRKYRFEVGYGLEGALPDGLVGSIGREFLAPNFRKGDYFTGIVQAVDAVVKASRGEYRGEPGAKGEGASGGVFDAVFWLLFILVVCARMPSPLFGGMAGAGGGALFASGILALNGGMAAVAAIAGFFAGWSLASANHRYFGDRWSSRSPGGGWFFPGGSGGFSGDSFIGGGGGFGGGGASGNW